MSTERGRCGADTAGVSDTTDQSAAGLLRVIPTRAWITAGGLSSVIAVAIVGGAWQLGQVAVEPSTGAVLTLAVWWLLRPFGWMIQRQLWGPAVERACGEWRRQLLARALGQRIDVLVETSAGELVDRIDDDTATVATALTGPVLGVSAAGLAAVFSAGLAASTTVWALPGFLVTAGMVAFTTWKLAPPATRAQESLEASWTEVSVVIEEAVAAREDVRAMSGRSYVLARFGAAVHNMLGVRRRAAQVQARMWAASAGAVTGVVCTSAIVAVIGVRAGTVPLAGAVSLVALALSFASQISSVTRSYPKLVEGIGAARRVRELAHVALEAAPSQGRTPQNRSVVFARAGFTYPGAEFAAVENVTLTIPDGRNCGLVGRTGAGKSTLVSLLTRQVDTPPGTVFLGGVDVTELDIETLRSCVGVVSQRTELLAASLAANVSLFTEIGRETITAAFEELGLAEWVDSLPDGLDTRIGPGGLELSAGEAQLVAFARLLVRDPLVVVLDEATARMDPQTEERVVRAAARLLHSRTGILVAHRLGTLRSCDELAVLEAGRIIEHGPRAALVGRGGPFTELVTASGLDPEWLARSDPSREELPALERRTRLATPDGLSAQPQAEVWRPSLTQNAWKLITADPRRWLAANGCFVANELLSYSGVIGSLAWARTVAALEAGRAPWFPLGAMLAAAIAAIAAGRRGRVLYPMWWSEASCRLRGAILAGQLSRHRVRPRPPGEVVARALTSDRVVWYVDLLTDVAVVVVIMGTSTGVLIGWLPGLMLVATTAVPLAAALAVKSQIVERANATADARAQAAVLLSSVIDGARTVKLFHARDAVVEAYGRLDRVRVRAAVRELRLSVTLDELAGAVNALGIIGVWAACAAGMLSTTQALAGSGVILAFGHSSWMAQACVGAAASAHAWLARAAPLAQREDLVQLDGELQFSSDAPVPPRPGAVALAQLELVGLQVVHDDGLVGVQDCSFTVNAGELVLIVGEVASGKSSLLGALAGLRGYRGEIRWNGTAVEDPESFFRPGQVAYVAQLPRVLSGSFTENITLGYGYHAGDALHAAQMGSDVERAGGADTLVGHRGVRLSGGQVQRLALARALAADTELLVADDISSALDATTELAVWDSLRGRGCTVIASSTKLAAVERADQVVVLEAGRQVAVGRWAELADRYGRLVS